MKKVKKLFAAILAAFMLLSAVPVASAAEMEDEGNNSYATAQVLSENDEISGVISTYDDVDYFKIVAPSNGKLTITFAHSYVESGESWEIQTVLYSNGEYSVLSINYVKLSDSEKITLPLIGAVDNGVYYVIVKEALYNNITGNNYNIIIGFTETDYQEKELNNTYQTASAINIGREYGGCIGNSNDVDCYKVVAPANGRLSFSFSHSFIDENEKWSVEIVYYSGTEYTVLSTNEISLNGNEMIVLPAVGVIKNGVYFVIVKELIYNDIVGHDYYISSSFAVTEFYEKEMNNSYQTANEIIFSETYKGCINNWEDSDFYKIKATTNGEFVPVFSHDFIDAYESWTIEIIHYSDGIYTSLSRNNVYLNGNERTELPVVSTVKDGIYFIIVTQSSYDNVVGYEYNLSCTVSSDELEQYTVFYNANGGSYAPTAQTKMHGTALKLSSSVPTKKYTITYVPNGGEVHITQEEINCVFSGWNTKANGAGASYAPGTKYTSDANLYLYAQWTNPVISMVPRPHREGYSFEGWYTAEGVEVEPSSVIWADITLYAKWEKIQTDYSNCTISIRTPSVTTIKYGETLVLHADIDNVFDLPENASIYWEFEGTGISLSADTYKTSCRVTSVANGTATVTATIVDINGTPLVYENGDPISASVALTSKAGFFQKLISFFKNLFGISRIIEQFLNN